MRRSNLRLTRLKNQIDHGSFLRIKKQNHKVTKTEEDNSIEMCVVKVRVKDTNIHSQN